MEAIAAIGLVTNVLHIVEVARDITFTVKDIRKSASGIATETKRFQEYANFIRGGMGSPISTTSARHSADEDLQEQLSTLCGELDAFEAQLVSLRSENPKSCWQACKTAFKIWCERDRLSDQARTIDEMSNQISVHLVTVHLPRMDVKLDELRAEHADMSTQLSRDMEQLFKLLQTSHGKDQGSESMLQSMKKWFTTQDERAVELGCLQALYFPDHKTRESGIKPAHEETFQWILSDAADATSETNRSSADDVNDSGKDRTFLRWLRSKDGQENVFCIFGKPGAGKSTLMKYLAHQDALKKELQTWAGDCELIIAQHFFWIHGSVSSDL